MSGNHPIYLGYASVNKGETSNSNHLFACETLALSTSMFRWVHPFWLTTAVHLGMLYAWHAHLVFGERL